MTEANVVELEPPSRPCPDWCTHHRGEQPNITALVASDATLSDDIVPVGTHAAVLYERRRQYLQGREVVDKDAVMVLVNQPISPAGLWPANLYLRIESRGIRPEGVSLRFGPREARAVAQALLTGADILETLLQGRCEACGDAIPENRVLCVDCTMLANRRRRQTLTPVQRATD